MKKQLMIACVLLCSMHMCFGQFTPGQKVLGGVVALGIGRSRDTSANGSNSNSFSFGISPSFGKFKNEKTLSEFNFNVLFDHNKRTGGLDSTTFKSLTIGVGYSITKLYTIASKVYFTLGYGTSFSYQKSTNDYGYNYYSSATNYYGLNFGITPGILIPVRNNKMLLRTGFSNLGGIGFGYSKQIKTYTNGSNYATNNLTGNLSFGSGNNFFNGLYVGLSWLLK